jgi:hypothetical protein
MKGKDIIEYIQDNHLEDAVVSVTATMYYPGDHDCRTTTDVSVGENSVYDDDTRKYVKTIDFYIDSNLY